MKPLHKKSTMCSDWLAGLVWLVNCYECVLECTIINTTRSCSFFGVIEKFWRIPQKLFVAQNCSVTIFSVTKSRKHASYSTIHQQGRLLQAPISMLLVLGLSVWKVPLYFPPRLRRHQARACISESNPTDIYMLYGQITVIFERDVGEFSISSLELLSWTVRMQRCSIRRRWNRSQWMGTSTDNHWHRLRVFWFHSLNRS